MTYRIKNNNGISLVETILYVAIFTMVSILVINSFITVMGSFATTRTNRNLLEAGISTMERISREIRQAENIDLTNSILNVVSSDLSLNNSKNTTVKRFIKEDGSLNLYECSSLGALCETYSGNLLGENIYLESLVFRRIATTEGEAVKIEMTLKDQSSSKNKTANFYNTIILKGGY